MYILTDKNNIVVYITTEASLRGEGIYVGNNTLFSDKTLNIIPLDSVSDEITVQKYCYIKEKGFYLNPLYSPTNTSDAISEKVNYIINKIDPEVDENKLTLDEMKNLYISKIDADCDATIDLGTDVTLTDGTTEHFSLTIKDQKNIDKLVAKISTGMEQVPYHSDSNQCKLYSAEDISKISLAADKFILYNTTYCKSLNTWIRRCTTKDEIKQISFGASLPDDLQTALNQIMDVVNVELSKLS